MVSTKHYAGTCATRTSNLLDFNKLTFNYAKYHSLIDEIRFILKEHNSSVNHKTK